MSDMHGAISDMPCRCGDRNNPNKIHSDVGCFTHGPIKPDPSAWHGMIAEPLSAEDGVSTVMVVGGPFILGMTLRVEGDFYEVMAVDYWQFDRNICTLTLAKMSRG